MNFWLSKIKHFILISCTISMIVCLLNCNKAMANIGTFKYKVGVLAGKGPVLGEKGQYIIVEYDEKGEIKQEFENPYERYKDARIMSADDYKFVIDTFRELKEKYKDDSEILTKQEFEDKDFPNKSNKNQLIEKPELKINTNYVLYNVKYLDETDLIISEFYIDIRLNESLEKGTCSVLLSSKGKVLYQSKLNLGYKNAYYTSNEFYIVEYTLEGETVEKFNQLEEPYINAVIMSASDYRSHSNNYLTPEEAEKEKKEIISVKEYMKREFKINDKTISKPLPKKRTYFILINKEFKNAYDLISYEFPIDINKIEPLEEDSFYVILHRNGSVYYQTKNYLGYEVKRDKNKGLDRLSGFNRNKDKLLAPVIGSMITVNLGNSRTFTDRNGLYALMYYIPPCPGYTMNYYCTLIAELKYGYFNPKSRVSIGKFLKRHSFDEYCSGLSASTIPVDSLSSIMVYMEIKAAEIENSTNSVDEIHFPIDLSMLTGTAKFSNIQRKDNKDVFDNIPMIDDSSEEFKNYTAVAATSYTYQKIKFGEETKYNEFDMNTDGKDDNFFIKDKKDEKNKKDEKDKKDDYVQFYIEDEIDPENDRPFLIRLRDRNKILRHNGLLETIGKKDIENTDIYVFRKSNNQIILERKGLQAGEGPEFHRTDIISELKDEARINYKLAIGGRDALAHQFLGWNHDRWQSKTNVAPELLTKPSDLPRAGEIIQIIIVNRATGYMGTGYARLGLTYSKELKSSLIGTLLESIKLLPPNLKIYAERKYKTINATSTDEKERKSLIGFEGSGLIDDSYIVIYSKWLDQNGLPLPEDLPGFTGRLAKIVEKNKLNQISNFEIKPGYHTQVLQLPQNEIDKGHYYIHVNGEAPEGGPSNFSSKANFDELGAGKEALEYRPKHYVPIKVPFFNESITLNNAYNQIKTIKEDYKETNKDLKAKNDLILEDIEKGYIWLYRPEYQFSLYHFEHYDIDFETKFNDDLNVMVTTVDMNYDLKKLKIDPLERFEGNRQFVFGVGYQETLAETGSSVDFHYSDVLQNESLLLGIQKMEQNLMMSIIPEMQDEDFIALQLYQADDPGNALYEYLNFPLLVGDWQPFALKRTIRMGAFENKKTGNPKSTDDFKIITFWLTQESYIKIGFSEKETDIPQTFIDEKILKPGAHAFLLDFKTLEQYFQDNFIVKIEAESVEGNSSQTVLMKGTLIEKVEGKMLGQIIAHDVLIQDGSLNLSRQDFALKGLGPQIAFSRSYNNQRPPERDDILGPGWSHNYDLILKPLSTRENFDGSVPFWVEELRERFFSPEDIPDDNKYDWTVVLVNGTLFRKQKSSGEWTPQFGKHGKLNVLKESSQSGNEPVEEKFFIYTEKDGTKYKYKYPYFKKVKDDDGAIIHVADSIIYRLLFQQKALIIPGNNSSGGYPETPLESIIDRNSNEMTLAYENNLLTQVNDAVNRSMTFKYGDVNAGFFGKQKRIVSVLGPDDISVNFTYNDKGYLTSASRDTKIEKYNYVIQNEKNQSTKDEYNLSRVDDLNKSTLYEYCIDGDIDSAKLKNMKVIMPYLKTREMIKTIEYSGIEKKIEFKYETDTNTREITDLRGHKKIFVLNNYGNTNVIREEMENSQYRITKMEWSIDSPASPGYNDNVMLSRTNGRKFKISYAYDDNGNVTHETSPYNETKYQNPSAEKICSPLVPCTKTQWHQKFNVPTKKIDKNNIKHEWIINNENGNVEEHSIGNSIRMKYEYYTVKNKNAVGLLKILTDPEDNKTNYVYDKYGNLSKFIKPENVITAFTNDVRGRTKSTKDQYGNVTTFTYNDLDQKTNIEYPEIKEYTLPQGSSRNEIFTYYSNGLIKTEENRMGLKLTYYYDCKNRVEKITRYDGAKKIFTYDDNDNLLTETDWNDNKTTYSYDKLNRKIAISKDVVLGSGMNSSTKQIQYKYDLADNVIQEIDYNGFIVDYEYDEMNRVTNTWKPKDKEMKGSCKGQLSYSCIQVEYEYYNESDSEKNLKSITEKFQEDRKTEFVYNNLYLLTKRIKRTDTGENEHIWDYDNNGNLVYEKDEEGKSVSYEYDEQNRLTKEKRVVNGETFVKQKQYNDNTNIIIETIENYQEITTNYDAWNRPYQTIVKEIMDEDNSGKEYITINEYDAGGNVVKTEDPEKRIRKWERDKRGLVEKEIIVKAKKDITKTEFKYDYNGNVEEEIRYKDIGSLLKTSYYYNEDNQLIKKVEHGNNLQDSRETKIYYDLNGNTIETIDYKGNSYSTEYNALNLPIKECDPYYDKCKEISYYKSGKVKSIIDKRGYKKEFTYDKLDREKTIIEEVVKDNEFYKTEKKVYDNVGNLKEVVDKRGFTTFYEYDDLYRVKEIRRGNSSKEIRIELNEYDLMGNKIKVTDANKNTTTYTYNSLNLLIKTTYPDGTDEIRKYDNVGNLKKSISEDKKETTFEYDEENRVIEKNFQGQKTYSIYDIQGNLLSTIHPEGNCREMKYDTFNRLIEVIDDPSNPIDSRCTKNDGLNLITKYEYDKNNNLTHQIDPNNNDVEFEYDQLNRKKMQIQHKQAEDLITRYYYDEEGNMVTLKDPENNKFSYEYDGLGRKIKSQYPNNKTPFYTIREITHDYDENDNITRVEEQKTNNDGTSIKDITINSYDMFDRLISSNQRGYTLIYDYDPNGNRTLVKTASGTTSYTYNNRNWLTDAVINNVSNTKYEYYPDGKQKNLTYPNNTKVEYKYNELNQLTQISNLNNNKILSKFTYTYDNNGNRKKQTEYQSAFADAEAYTEVTTYDAEAYTEVTTYDYDALDRMKSYTIWRGSEQQSTVQYTFEAYNRKTETITEDNNTNIRKYHYDETNWLTKITEGSDPDHISKTIHYTYDNNGNTIRKTDTSISEDIAYTYNSKDQLVQVTRGPPAGEIDILGQYDYNSEGMRIRHKYSERGNINYFYDDTAVIEERNDTNNNFLARYHYSDRLICLQQSNFKNQYYHQDALGSTTNLSTDDGEIKVRYKLNPWGKITEQKGESNNRQVFTGQEHDENTGLIYFGARYYDEDTGRFYSRDKYIGKLIIPPSLHKYQYAYQNPTAYIDPDGNIVFSATAIAIFAYLGKCALQTSAETGIEYAISKAQGKKDFNTRYVFTKNMVINMATGLIPLWGEAKLVSKSTKLTKALFIIGGEFLEYGIETAGDSFSDYLIKGGSFSQHVLPNAVANLFGKGLGYGISSVVKKSKNFISSIFRKRYINKVKLKAKSLIESGFTSKEAFEILRTIYDKSGKDYIPSSFKVTGGASYIKWWEDYEKAEIVYNMIRRSKTDISLIAENTGMKRFHIKKIKDHLFYMTHQLDDAIRRFDADPEIANAWKRLESGDYTANDITLLKHELVESKYMGMFKKGYREAHQVAERIYKWFYPDQRGGR